MPRMVRVSESKGNEGVGDRRHEVRRGQDRGVHVLVEGVTDLQPGLVPRAALLALLPGRLPHLGQAVAHRRRIGALEALPIL